MEKEGARKEEKEEGKEVEQGPLRREEGLKAIQHCRNQGVTSKPVAASQQPGKLPSTKLRNPSDWSMVPCMRPSIIIFDAARSACGGNDRGREGERGREGGGERGREGGGGATAPVVGGSLLLLLELPLLHAPLPRILPAKPPRKKN